MQTVVSNSQHKQLLDKLEKANIFTADLGLTAKDIANLPPGSEVNVQLSVPSTSQPMEVDVVQLPDSNVDDDSEAWSYSVTDTGNEAVVDSQSVVPMCSQDSSQEIP